MGLSHIVVRAVFGYVCAVALVRVSGHRTVTQSDTPSFVLAVIIGDMFDDLFWAEVPAAQFVTAVGTLVFCHLWSTLLHAGAGRRTWRREIADVVP